MFIVIFYLDNQGHKVGEPWRGYHFNNHFMNWRYKTAIITILFLSFGWGITSFFSAFGMGEIIPSPRNFYPTYSDQKSKNTASTSLPITQAFAASPTALSSPTEPMVTRTPQPSPTFPACLKKGGRIEKTSLRDGRLSLPMEIRIFLPPCYDEEPARRYPVLYLIHGQNFTEDQWERLGAPKTAERLIAEQRCPPFLIVMPRDRLWTSPRESPFGAVFMEKLIPYIDSNYRTKTERIYRAIGGLSRGGAWAMHLGISQWQYFGAIGSHSSFYFYGEEYQTKHWFEQIPTEAIPRIFVDIGRDDFLRDPNQQLEEMLLQFHIPHEWYIYPGRHEESYWQAHIEQYLLWYASAW